MGACKVVFQVPGRDEGKRYMVHLKTEESPVLLESRVVSKTSGWRDKPEPAYGEPFQPRK